MIGCYDCPVSRNLPSHLDSNHIISGDINPNTLVVMNWKPYQHINNLIHNRCSSQSPNYKHSTVEKSVLPHLTCALVHCSPTTKSTSFNRSRASSQAFDQDKTKKSAKDLDLNKVNQDFWLHPRSELPTNAQTEEVVLAAIKTQETQLTSCLGFSPWDQVQLQGIFKWCCTIPCYIMDMWHHVTHQMRHKCWDTLITQALDHFPSSFL